MARRRRTFDSHLCSSVSFSTVLICLQERTSCVFSNFAQSSWRRFTDTSGVSLLGSDADLLRTPSLTPSASVGSASEPSDLHSNEESLDLVAGNSRVSQIWRAQFPTSASLMFLPSSAAAVPAWCFSRNVFHSQAAGQNLGFQVLGQSWASQIMGLLLVLDLLGLMDGKPMFASPQLNVANSFSPCRFRLWSPLATFIGLDSHLIAFQEVFSATPFNWCISPMSWIGSEPTLQSCPENQDASLPLSQSSSCRVQERSFPSSFCLKERIIPLVCLSLRTVEFNIPYLHNCSSPRYQNSSCRGQREIAVEFNLLYLDNCSSPRYQNSSCRGQREIVFTILLLEGENSSTIILVFMALVCCACVARSGLELKGVSSETLLSDIVKGSAKVAVSMIVISVLAAVSIANNRSLCVLFVSQGIVSLTSSKIVKVRRLPDDIYGLSVKIACIYHVIFHICVFRLPFEAAMTLLSFVVTNYSFYGDY